MIIKPLRKCGAFTVTEMMVGSAAAVVIGLCIYAVLNSGSVLYAKNTASNIAHDESRIAVNRLMHDIHEAVSIPQLGHFVPGNLAANPTAPVGSWTPYGTNVTFYAEPSPSPAGSAAVAFQMMGGPSDPNGGPFNIVNDPGNPELIQIGSGNTAPQIGMRLIFPYYKDMEEDITKVTSNGSNHYNVWTKDEMEKRFKTKKNTYNICYYTTRWAYSIENGELRIYSSAPGPNGLTWPVVVARNIVSATPFTQPTTQYIGVNLTTQASNYTNRNYKAVNTLLAGSIPYRAQLCVKQ